MIIRVVNERGTTDVPVYLGPPVAIKVSKDSTKEDLIAVLEKLPEVNKEHLPLARIPGNSISITWEAADICAVCGSLLIGGKCQNEICPKKGMSYSVATLDAKWDFFDTW